jgi:hypothetical protein
MARNILSRARELLPHQRNGRAFNPFRTFLSSAAPPLLQAQDSQTAFPKSRHSAKPCCILRCCRPPDRQQRAGSRLCKFANRGRPLRRVRPKAAFQRLSKMLRCGPPLLPFAVTDKLTLLGRHLRLRKLVLHILHGENRPDRWSPIGGHIFVHCGNTVFETPPTRTQIEP